MVCHGSRSTLAGLPLSSFTPAVREWFERAFEAPTPAQALAWPAIATGEHVLISAPTGSGKTLAAFLWALDKLGREPAAHTRLVYVSPLKALAYDVDRNLRAPLRGDAPQPARHPHHDARVAVPDPHLAGARDAARRRVDHRRRDPRRRFDQARLAPRAHARAPRRALRPRAPAHRPERDAEPARGGRALHGRAAAQGDDRRRRRAQAARPQDPRSG